jgi:hypothetical protein
MAASWDRRDRLRGHQRDGGPDGGQRPDPPGLRGGLPRGDRHQAGPHNPLGALIAVYFLATGTAGLELLGAQTYFQQIFYGAALVASITIPKVTRDRIFKRRRAV